MNTWTMPADRTGCCDKQRKPCSYHEGWADAIDVTMPSEGELQVILNFDKFGIIVSGVTNYATAAEALRALAVSFDEKWAATY